jgi:hypothetical protein
MPDIIETSILPPGARLVKNADPQALQEGALWILAPDHTLINALCDPATFDALVSQYVDLYDRLHWPQYHRVRVIGAAKGAIPTYFIPRDLWTPTMQEQAERLQALSSQLSTQGVIEQIGKEEEEDNTSS